MTDKNNGWPGKPGVPLNPERDGWHIVQEGDLDPEFAFWRSYNFLEHDLGWWETKGGEDFIQPYETSNWRYFGPALSHDQATALQARADQAALGHAREADRADLSEFLHKRDVAALRARVAELEAALHQILDQSCDTFHINPEGGANIVVEGQDRLAFESDFVALVNIARVALEGKKE